MTAGSPPTDAVVCLLTTPQCDARAIAEKLVESKLAACVNILAQVQSLYWWEGKIEHDEESLLVVKTTRAAVTRLDELLREIHPYDTFELVAFDVIAGSHRYLEWIGASVDTAS